MVQAIVEVRDYTIDPEWLEPYRKWATELAVPWLRANLELGDFWVDCGFDAEVSGTIPAPSVIGQPNVCWIIRWPNKTARDQQFNKVMSSEGWRDIWAQHPNTTAYLHMNVRFFKPA